MANETNNIWVDSTFIESDDNTKDVDVEFYKASSAENIGSYSLPVVYSTFALTVDDVMNSVVEYFHVISTISGSSNLTVTYYDPAEYLSVMDSLVSFTQNLTTISGAKDISTIYSTGQYEIVDSKNIFADYKVPSEANEHPGIDFYLYYTNSTGYTNSSGVYIPYLNTEVETDIVYNAGTSYSQIGIDEYVDVFFSGWIWFYNTMDVFSTAQGTLYYIDFDATTISGAVLYNQVDIFAAVSVAKHFYNDIYSATVVSGSINFETQNIDGGLTFIDLVSYSCTQNNTALSFNVDLNPIKATNFSLGIGEFTTASGNISIEVLDDECNLTTSGVYWIVDGVPVTSTLYAISGGYRVIYDPFDDFESIEGPTTFTIHAENDCGYYVERDFYLTFGYFVEFNNSKDLLTNIDFGFDNKVAVRVTAEDYASCPTLSSLAWQFESKQYFNCDLGASITGMFAGSDNKNLTAEIYPKSTAYFYGKEFRVIINAKDFSGNNMEPVVLVYRIEDNP